MSLGGIYIDIAKFQTSTTVEQHSCSFWPKIKGFSIPLILSNVESSAAALLYAREPPEQFYKLL